jgi:hypothetical protein
MKKHILALLLSFILLSGVAQEITDFLPKNPPKNAKENAGYFFAGLGLQLTGIVVTTGSVYIMIDQMDEEYNTDIGPTGFGIGIGLTAAGTVLMASSVKNMILARRSCHDYKKSQKHKGVSFQIEPTNYGVGLVCRF